MNIQYYILSFFLLFLYMNKMKAENVLQYKDITIYSKHVNGRNHLFLEAVLISFDKFVKHDLDECDLYHDFRSFSEEFIIDG